MQGEEQKKLDVLSNDIMINSLRASGKCAVLVSEELEDAVIIEDRYKGKYCVVFDPLDAATSMPVRTLALCIAFIESRVFVRLGTSISHPLFTASVASAVTALIRRA